MNRKRSGKDAAANDDTEGGLATEAPPPKDRMADWAFGETKIANVGDRALLKLAAQAVKGAAKRAKSLNAGLGIAKGAADDRMNEADALITAIKGTDNRKDVTVAAPLLRCAQVGISFLIEKTVKLRTQEVEDCGVEDTETLDAQLRTLERIARDLGMQGQLWEEPTPAAQKKDDGQSDAFDGKAEE
jgi:hypothetical protein